ncbi:lysocardiolipin acyltransferase 1 [Reticulomyxa filosa]|uniref:Lysocardiolipin acyltransferase 1 n=1 Tax=Reticulomyxa filosa TaxID=46433 RepID=X6MVU4_RETFI|nr:lysocardiolipin acyltransferase 1 [Reticulomyxa filosa]|eukprot:ETO17582.1 lysocardiolipin acyltransferase 1 [Reticulomyxa filosa]
MHYNSMLFTYLAFVLEYGCNIKVMLTCTPVTYELLKWYVSGDYTGRGSIVLMSNHRTRQDWMMSWLALVRLHLCSYLVIVMKMGIRQVPILGWMVQWMSIFMNRKWTQDSRSFNDLIRFYCNVISDRTSRTVFLFYPEGTDLYDKALLKSWLFADANNLPRYHYGILLHPRTLGATNLVHTIGDDLYCIVDLTIAFLFCFFFIIKKKKGYVDYEENERGNEALFVQGRWPRRVLFHLECFTLESIVKQYKENVLPSLQQSESDIGNVFYSPLTELPPELFYQNNDPTSSSSSSSDSKQQSKDDSQMKLEMEALTDFVQRSFLLKEIRLGLWYENHQWMEDCTTKN